MMHFVFFVRSAVVALLDLGLLSSTDLKSVTRAWQVADTIGILNSSFSVDRAGAETITINRSVCCSILQKTSGGNILVIETGVWHPRSKAFASAKLDCHFVASLDQ